MATSGIFSSLAFVSVYTLGIFLSWRKVAMICAIVPICVLIAIFFAPETPIWLLSKNRTKEALKALQWLRGCVTPETVHEEYQDLQNYSIKSKTCNQCEKLTIKCDHKERWNDKIKQISRRRIVKPFILITTLQIFLQFCAINTWRPYTIQILNAYDIRWNANVTTVIMSLVGFFGRLCVLPVLKTLGKRRIYLFSSILTCICCFGLS